jgi:hypothetical protein
MMPVRSLPLISLSSRPLNRRSPASWRHGSTPPCDRKRAARRSTSSVGSRDGRAPDLALETVFGEIGRRNAGLGVAQRCGDLSGIVADGRNDTEARDDDASHERDLFFQIVRTTEASGRCFLLFLREPYTRSVALYMVSPSAFSQPSAMPSTRRPRITRLKSMPYSTFVFGRHHALELHLAGGKGHALALLAEPAEEEAGQLPHGVEAQAARHDRVADEVAGEEPVVGFTCRIRRG